MKLTLPLIKSSFFGHIVVLPVLILCILSCKKDSEDIYQETKPDAKIRFINASKKSSEVDLFVNNMKLNVQSISYGEATNYLKVPSGDKRAVISSDNVQEVSANIKFLPTFSYTSFLIENKTGPKELFTIQDNLGAVEEGKAKIRFVNTSPYFTNSINATLTGGYLLVNALPFKQASGYFQIDPSVSIRINIVGSGINKTIPTSDIEAGKSYTIWVSGATNADLTLNQIIYN